MPDGTHSFTQRRVPLRIPPRKTDYMGIAAIVVFSVIAGLAVPAIVLKTVEIMKRPLNVEKQLSVR